MHNHREKDGRHIPKDIHAAPSTARFPAHLREFVLLSVDGPPARSLPQQLDRGPVGCGLGWCHVHHLPDCVSCTKTSSKLLPA